MTNSPPWGLDSRLRVPLGTPQFYHCRPGLQEAMMRALASAGWLSLVGELLTLVLGFPNQVYTEHALLLVPPVRNCGGDHSPGEGGIFPQG